MHQALKPFKVATKIFEKDTAPAILELFEISDQLHKLTLEGGFIYKFSGLLKSSIEERFPECGVWIQIYAVTHFLETAIKGSVLEVIPEGYPRTPDSSKGLIPRAIIFYMGIDPYVLFF